MADFPANPTQHDPYKNSKFRVYFDGVAAPIAGISRISGLQRSTDVVEHREGGDPSTSRKSPGLTQYAPITLERGLTQDLEFEYWANTTWSPHAPETSPSHFRKDVTIDLHNDAGQTVLRYRVFRCWPSHYQAVSELDANGTTVAVELLTLQNEGWERDHSLPEPAAP